MSSVRPTLEQYDLKRAPSDSVIVPPLARLALLE